MKELPPDQSCRISRGGCGRPVIVIREKFNRRPFGQNVSRQDRHQVAIHEDEFDEHPERERERLARVDGDRFNRLRFDLEMKCAAQQERLKDNVKEATNGSGHESSGSRPEISRDARAD